MIEVPPCLECGACCHADEVNYIPVRPADAERLRDAKLDHFVRPCGYMKMCDGHCAALDVGSERFFCTVYEDRPDACRRVERMSAECLAAIIAREG